MDALNEHRQTATQQPRSDASTASAAMPQHTELHEALSVFLGNWEATGTSYGYTDQSGDDPRTNGVPWVSEHDCYWHTGEFFLIQNERASPGGQVFDTLSVMGVDLESGEYFARCFENHGFYRKYRVTRDGSTWQLLGEFERATIVFSDNNRRQTITWEWRPQGQWLPLCDRVAVRKDRSN